LPTRWSDDEHADDDRNTYRRPGLDDAPRPSDFCVDASL
jgi:hypothetical protein